MRVTSSDWDPEFSEGIYLSSNWIFSVFAEIGTRLQCRCH